MTLLRTIESRLSRLVEGAFGRAFRTPVQPAELARRMAREMDSHQSHSMREVYVPNVFEVYLSPDDREHFEGIVAAMTSELAEYLAEHARRRGYALLTRPRVMLNVDEDLQTGEFGIAARIEEPAQAPAPPAVAVPAPQATTVQPAVATPPPVAAMGFRLAYADGAVTICDSKVSIGRGSANDLVIGDASVSRVHATLTPTPAGLMLQDENSTNGVFVNGAKVSQQIVSSGDSIRLGSVEFTLSAQASAGAGADAP